MHISHCLEAQIFFMMLLFQSEAESLIFMLLLKDFEASWSFMGHENGQKNRFLHIKQPSNTDHSTASPHQTQCIKTMCKGSLVDICLLPALYQGSMCCHTFATSFKVNQRTAGIGQHIGSPGY